jgi:hypothetical protein
MGLPQIGNRRINPEGIKMLERKYDLQEKQKEVQNV